LRKIRALVLEWVCQDNRVHLEYARKGQPSPITKVPLACAVVILILSKSDQITFGELAGELGLQTEKLQQVVHALSTEELPLVQVTQDSGISLNSEFRTD
jgi:hypothetical protein